MNVLHMWTSTLNNMNTIMQKRLYYRVEPVHWLEIGSTLDPDWSGMFLDCSFWQVDWIDIALIHLPSAMILRTGQPANTMRLFSKHFKWSDHMCTAFRKSIFTLCICSSAFHPLGWLQWCTALFVSSQSFMLIIDLWERKKVHLWKTNAESRGKAEEQPSSIKGRD